MFMNMPNISLTYDTHRCLTSGKNPGKNSKIVWIS